VLCEATFESFRRFGKNLRLCQSRTVAKSSRNRLIAVAVPLLAHRLLTMAAVRIHRARPEFGQETSAAAIAEGRAWLKQALEWPRRRESWR
jgi:hypothetical protein